MKKLVGKHVHFILLDMIQLITTKQLKTRNSKDPHCGVHFVTFTNTNMLPSRMVHCAHIDVVTFVEYIVLILVQLFGRRRDRKVKKKDTNKQTKQQKI